MFSEEARLRFFNLEEVQQLPVITRSEILHAMEEILEEEEREKYNDPYVSESEFI